MSLILAIETSCDETAAAVVADGREIRSNIVSSQIDVHQATGGVVPEVASRLQLETIGPVIEQAMAGAKTGWTEIDAIAVTVGPGLIGPLLVGVETAKALALARNLPLIPVNHLAGHLYACFHPYLSSSRKRGSDSRRRGNDIWDFPYLALIVSGNHTELVLMRGQGRFELLGSTRDDAAGEAFDKVARLLGLPYPGGPEISRLAERGDPGAIKLPIAMADQDNFDFSFSGLKSAVRREVEGRSIKNRSDQWRADLAASFQAVVVDSLVGKTRRAARVVKPTAVLLGGGVAANRLLRRKLAAALDQTLLPTPPELATDNAAMIGLAAYWQRREALSGRARLTVAADPGLSLAGADRSVARSPGF